MEGNSFWLIYIQDDYVSVSLVSRENKSFRVLSVGPQKPWDSFDASILNKAVDESLSVASLNANITEDQEPSNAAFVVPPFWVSSDGKIMPAKLKFIKEICKELSFSPSGFLAEDEALVEESNRSDGFPASFILLHLSKQEFYLSLVYLSHIRERVKKGFDGEFTGQNLESAILEFKSESALPPQIIVFGNASPETITSLKNFPWVGKKNIETFLHFPDIKLYSDNEVITTFTKVISNQLNPNKSSVAEPLSSDTTKDFEKTEIKENPVEETEAITNENEIKEEKLMESPPEDLGFSVIKPTSNTSPLPIISPDQLPQSLEIGAEPNLDPFEPPVITPPIIPSSQQKIKFSFKFPKIKFPKISHSFWWIALAVLPFLIIAPLFLVSSQITLFTTPYQFDKSIPVTLKTSDATIDDLNKSIIPVQKETIQIDAKATVETTGQKTIGEKAKGEIIIFNKLDKTQNIPNGSILTDSSGKKFELTTAVSVNASSSDLEKGVITLGQTKTVVMAVDIGSEFNLATDTKLTLKDFPETSLIAKADSAFTGGNRQQIRAVSQTDKTNVQSEIDEQISKNIDDQINKKIGNISGIIDGTIQTQKDKLELSREIGEAADELTATIKANVTVFVLPEDVKDQVIKHFLASEPDFPNIDYQSKDFNLSFNLIKIDVSQASGTLTISGKSLPKTNISQVQKSLTGKTTNQANSIIKKLIPRAYNFHINNNLPILPLRSDNINIEIKTESL